MKFRVMACNCLIKEVLFVIKTKLFSWYYDEMKTVPKIDAQINEFVEKENVELVDVKFVVQSNVESCIEEITALILYKENK